MFPNLNDENLDEETRKWLKTMPDNKVFEWLGNDLNDVPNYLHLLNLNWSDEDINSELKLFRETARKLSKEPEYLRQMIRTRFWRHTLVACISVILLEAKEFCADLKASFDQPNFVAPQIAVALGLLCPTEAIDYFGEVVRSANSIPGAENFMRDSTICTDPKRIVAAQTVLSKLEPKMATKLAKSDVFREHRNHMDGEIGASVAEDHWEFWLDVIKKQNPKSYWNK